jgi:hypothetical protein
VATAVPWLLLVGAEGDELRGQFLTRGTLKRSGGDGGSYPRRLVSWDDV